MVVLLHPGLCAVFKAEVRLRQWPEERFFILSEPYPSAETLFLHRAVIELLQQLGYPAPELIKTIKSVYCCIPRLLFLNSRISVS